MVRIELSPDLNHCIETVAKNEHTILLKQIMSLGQNDIELEEKFEVLTGFLKTANFKRLRSESEKQLNCGRRVVFVIQRDKTDITCKMNCLDCTSQ